MGFLKSEESSQMSVNALVAPNFTHAHAIGQTGCGKTTSFIYPNLLERIRQKHAILLYDFKGKEHLTLKYLAKKQGRLKDVLEIGKPWGAKINLLRLMDSASLHQFIERSTGFSRDNAYWSNSAAKLFLSVYDIVEALERLHHDAHKFRFKDAFFELLACEADLETEEYTYPYILTFKSIMDVCQNEQDLASFILHLDEIVKEMEELTVRVMKRGGTSRQNKLLKHASLIKNFLNLQSKAKRTASALISYKKVDGENPKLSIMMTLMPLVKIANTIEFNTDDYDLLDEIDKGKLISINAKDMSNELVEAVTYALFEQFSKRSMLSNVQPVSVFIDEAQRVISANQDHNLDVLRECKVEMFLAYQNEALMENKLGKNEYLALKQNLSTSFYFTNKTEQNHFDLDTLGRFECISSLNNYATSSRLEPSFIDKDKLYKVEHQFQKALKLFDELGVEELKEEAVLLYDAKYYAQDKVLSYSFSTEKTSPVEIFRAQDKTEILGFFNKHTKTEEPTQSLESKVLESIPF